MLEKQESTFSWAPRKCYLCVSLVHIHSHAHEFGGLHTRTLLEPLKKIKTPWGRKYQIYSPWGKIRQNAKITPEASWVSGCSFWDTTQRVTDISELKPLGVSELPIPHHQGFLKTSEQKWQRTTSSTFSEANSWLWDYFHCNQRHWPPQSKGREAVVSLSPGSNTSLAV